MTPNVPSSDSPLTDSPSSPRPQFQRATSGQWPPRTPSAESLLYMNSRSPTGSSNTSPKLRKRHSTYTLSPQQPERPPSPFGASPPQRPLRNPARGSSTHPEHPHGPQKPAVRTRSRPSTATGREDVVPWEYQQPTVPELRSPPRSGAPSVKSRASSTGLALTGPIEEVTPWELEDPPPMPPLDPAVSARPPSLNRPPSGHMGATGPVEEVTPWELYPAVIPEQVPDSPVAEDLTRSYVSHSHPHAPTTGTTEEVTPWELYPAIVDDPSISEDGVLNSKGPRNSLSMSKAQVEEVTPWELFPVPAPEMPSPVEDSATATVRKKTSRSSTRGTPSSASKALSELGLVRRRRSTGSKSLKPHASGPMPQQQTQPSISSSSSKYAPSTSSSSYVPRDRPPSVKSHHGAEGSPVTSPTTPKFGNISGSKSASGAAAPLYHTSSFSPPPIMLSSSLVPPPPLPLSHHPSSAPGMRLMGRSVSSESPEHKHVEQPHREQREQQNLKFSTVDRTILKELKRGITARATQFVVKGRGYGMVGGGISPGKKYHPYAREQVPYPRSYDREVVDLDVWETMFCQEICESLTWHVFEEPPARVLEIGCGTGTWILSCARAWKNCHLVGLDIVPLHPDLQQVGSPDLASRITWVQHNFLDGLPFPNEEFDFVHIKRIALGVPEDKWDALFEEITRVMKPGGAFEMIEEDLFFPGKSVDNNEESDLESDYGTSVSRRSSTTSNDGFEFKEQDSTSYSESRKSQDTSPATPTTVTTATTTVIPPTPSRSGSPTRGKHISFSENGDRNSYSVTAPPSSSVPSAEDPPTEYKTFIPPHSRSAARPTLQVKTTPFTSRFAGSAVSLLNGMGYNTSDSSPGLPDHTTSSARRRSSSIVTTTTAPSSATTDASHSSHNLQSALPQPSVTPAPSKKPTKVAPFVHRSLPRPPVNPRDHSILEAIYSEMLASRFINTSPVSLLTTYLEWHFNDVRTHPPLIITFPPPPAQSSNADNGDDQHHDPYDSDDARDAIIPSSERPRSTKSGNSGASARESDEQQTIDKRWLSTRSLLKHASPYITLDDSRGYAYAPSNKNASSSGITQKNSASGARKRLPNQTLNIDIKTLNLHLAMRAQEILACSEPMWEWVLDYQAKLRAQRAGRARSGSLEVPPPLTETTLLSGASGSSSDLHKNTILELTRDDFDHLLGNFEMDMQDQVALGNALVERFAWIVISSGQSLDRKAFDAACEKWDNWVSEQERRSNSHSYSQSSQHRSNNSVSNASMVSPSLGHPVSHDSAATMHQSDHDSTIGPSANGSSIAASSIPSPPASIMNHPSLLPAMRRLSRSMRVFVAWKAMPINNGHIS